jgi:excisionase family DNA binding protein
VTSQLSLEDLAAPRGLTRAELMTATEVAELLDVPVSTVREWGRNGTLPRVKLGRHVRFIRRHVESAILRAEEVRRSDQLGAGPGNPRELI